MNRKFFWTMFVAITLATVAGRVLGYLTVMAVQP